MTDYEEYLKRYAKAREISEAEAEQHLIVKEVKKHYGEDVSKSDVG